MDDVLVALTLVSVLGCGLNAGALFAFSSFVMGALAPARGAGHRGHELDQRRGRVLAEPSYRTNARAFQAEMMALPGPEEMVELLESLRPQAGA
jgi:hypothetical protein